MRQSKSGSGPRAASRADVDTSKRRNIKTRRGDATKGRDARSSARHLAPGALEHLGDLAVLARTVPDVPASLRAKLKPEQHKTRDDVQTSTRLREIPRECPTRTVQVPERPLDAFLIHDPGSFEPGKVETPQLSDSQWAGARLLLEDGYSLGICANCDEAILLAECVSRRFPFHTLVAYDDDDEIFWVARA